MLKLASSIFFLISITSFHVQAGIKIEKFDGDACKTVNGTEGACTILMECKSMINVIQTEGNNNNIVYCNFMGKHSVVCCPDKIPKLSEKKQDSGSPTDVHFQEDYEDEDHLPLISKVTTGTINNNPSIVKIEQRIGSKAENACTKWKKDTGRPFSELAIGGTAADPGEFPHMAGLGYPSTESGVQYEFKCGGSLISENFILTVAHCSTPVSKPVIARLGKLTLTNDDDYLTAVDVGIAEFIPHNLYMPSQAYYDIALIRLSKTVTFDEVIRPACLYTDTNDISPDVELYGTGWGLTENRTRSPYLLKTLIPSITLQVCRDSYAPLTFLKRRIPDGIIESQLCAHDLKEMNDTCDGDSGGPLQITTPDSQISTVVGIIANGLVCGSSVPGLYTRVAYYVEWIESIIWP